MSPILEFFEKLLDSSDWPPRWHCGKWTEFNGWVYIVSDLLIWAAYFAIPLIIIRYISKKENAQFIRIYFLFAGFILSCGATHFLDAVAFWIPMYRLNALVRLTTAVLSWITVFSLIKMLPLAFALRTPKDLNEEVEQRKKAEERFRNLLESAPDAIVIVNEAGIIQLVNAQTEKIFGYSRDEIIHEKVELLMPDRYNTNHPVHRNNFFENLKFRPMGEGLELFGKKKNGLEFPIEISLSPLETDEGPLVSAAIRDITAKKQMENEIREANAYLENKVQLRTTELLRKNKELEQFAYVASHDLQEPLRTLSSFAELIRKESQGKLDNRIDQYLVYIEQSSARMKTLIKDLLDYSRIGRENKLEQVDCKIMLDQTLVDLDKSIKESGMDIIAGPLPVITGYQTELKQLFQNLISNAIKFRKKNTPPQLRITAAKDNQYWKFSFQDNGIGIEEEFSERIFVIFQRLHNRAEYEGSGIGLSHCKKIVELHGGDIWMKSRLGEGTTFYFTLPETGFHAKN